MNPQRSLLQSHPQWAAAGKILQALQSAGHRALLAGGCVRDALLGVSAQDLDIATSATPEQVMGLFDKTVDVGKSFGVVRVLLDGADIEVATFRADGDYKDGRRPESVHYSDEREDALRRDFTVNALFYDPVKDEVLDYVGGKADLVMKSLRTVGEAERRFREDHLRLLRAVRFAVQLGFAIEPGTWDEIRRLAPLAASVSRERLRDELVKTFKHGAGTRGPLLLEDSGLLRALFPVLTIFSSSLLSGAEKLMTTKVDSAERALSRWLAPLALTEPGRRAAGEVLSSLRLAKAEERFIQRTLEILGDVEGFWAQTRGRRLLAFSEDAVAWALSLQDALHGVDPRHHELEGEWARLAPQGKLPPPLLDGNDLKTRLSGPELGRALREAYGAQLEGNFSDKAAALTWVDGWSKLGKE